MYVCCERLLELCGKSHSLSSLRQERQDSLREDLLAIDTSDSELNYSICSGDAKLINYEQSMSNLEPRDRLSLDKRVQKSHQQNSQQDQKPGLGRKKKKIGLGQKKNIPDRTSYGHLNDNEVENVNNTSANFINEITDDDGDDIDRPLSLKQRRWSVEDDDKSSCSSDLGRNVGLLHVEDVCNAIMITELTSKELTQTKKIEVIKDF